LKFVKAAEKPFFEFDLEYEIVGHAEDFFGSRKRIYVCWNLTKNFYY